MTVATVTSVSDIGEKVGFAIRDILRDDSALVALLARSANDAIHYGEVDSKTRFEKTYPYIRVDLLPSDYNDYSINGAAQSGLTSVKVTCFAWSELAAHKLSGASYKAITDADSTLLGQSLSHTGTSFSSGKEELDGRTLSNDGFTLSLNYIGSRS